jgi:DNA repair protein RecN (Recombination protein N)
MLRELRIRNVAIIDELELSLAPGMNVLTGETGAGKSIIMKAIGLLCGDRASVDLIRTDADEAEVEGLFDLDAALQALSATHGLAADDELVVRRVISRSGKGKVYLNGSLATTGALAQLGDHLLHVYGQHEHALLLRPENHLDLLDAFGAVSREAMTEAYGRFRASADRLAEATASGETVRQRLELLRFQVGELREAQLEAGMERALLQERERQRHAEKLMRICEEGEATLYAADEAVVTALGRVSAQLHEAARIDPEFAESAELLRQAASQVEDVALQLRKAAGRVRLDPERLEQIEERLALIARLKRKHGCDAEALLERLAGLEGELAGLEDAGADLTALRRESVASAARAWDVARQLSRMRQEAAARLETSMAAELESLGMHAATFRVVFKVCGADGPHSASLDPAAAASSGLSATGADTLEFYLSANPGEEPKPLARIASGGELSRVMLALKSLTAGRGDVPTLIFDEVDAGIGGIVAEAVGRRLHVIAESRQVLCITHLPQIAALADHHLAVEKRVAKGRTTTRARTLNADDRVREISRMLGSGATAESERYARRLIAGAAKDEAR